MTPCLKPKIHIFQGPSFLVSILVKISSVFWQQFHNPKVLSLEVWYFVGFVLHNSVKFSKKKCNTQNRKWYLQCNWYGFFNKNNFHETHPWFVTTHRQIVVPRYPNKKTPRNHEDEARFVAQNLCFSPRFLHKWQNVDLFNGSCPGYICSCLHTLGRHYFSGWTRLIWLIIFGLHSLKLT